MTAGTLLLAIVVGAIVGGLVGTVQGIGGLWLARRRRTVARNADVLFEPIAPIPADPRRIARNITIDHAHGGHVIVDDLVLPFHVTRDCEIDTITNGRRSTVTITIPAENVRALRTLKDDLDHIRAIADNARRALGLPLPERREPA